MENYQSLTSRPGHLGLDNSDRGDLSLVDLNETILPAVMFLELTESDA